MGQTTVGKIYAAMSAVMADISHIGKSRRNSQGTGYNFRGIDDIYNELHGHLSKHGVFCVPAVLEDRSEERQSKSGGALIYRILKVRYTFFAGDGSFVESVVIGEAMDSGDKASNKAMSAAQKYCFLQAFCIPTEESKDTEDETHEVAPKTQQKAPIYSDADERMRSAVMAALKNKRVPEEYWPSARAKLEGRPTTDLTSVLSDIGLGEPPH
jgi:hypothetical protein